MNIPANHAIGHASAALLGRSQADDRGVDNDIADKEAWTGINRARWNGRSCLPSTWFLSAGRRKAIDILDSFCREIGDIVDSDASYALKRRLLSDWRCEIARLYAGEARYTLTRALAPSVRDFRLRCEDFLAIIEGAEMDVRGDTQAPSLADLDLYSVRSTVAISRLSMHILDISESAADCISAELGRALQLTDILCNLAEDAAHHRLYLPRDLLLTHGVLETALDPVLANPSLPLVCHELALRAESHYAAALDALKSDALHRSYAILLALHLNRSLLRAQVARGWRRFEKPVSLPIWRRAILALSCGFLAK